MNTHRSALAGETNLFWVASLALRKARQEGDEAAIAECLDDIDLIATMTGNPALRRACLDVLTPAHSADAVA